MRVFVHLAYATGGRAGALLGLLWDRVDFERGRIDLTDPQAQAPQKRRAIVPMTNTLRRVLLEARESALTDYVIEEGHMAKSRDKGGLPRVNRGLMRVALKAGVGPVSPHDLRHTAARHLAEAGCSATDIALFLGHSVPGMSRATSIYAKYGADYLRDAIRALEVDL